MGYTTQPIIPIYFETGIFTPKDGTNYYIGPPINSLPAEIEGIRASYSCTSCVVRAAAVSYSAANDPSHEDLTFTILVNGITEYALLVNAAAENYRTYIRGLNIPLKEGDFIEIKLVTPAFFNVPIGMGIQIVLFAGL